MPLSGGSVALQGIAIKLARWLDALKEKALGDRTDPPKLHLFFCINVSDHSSPEPPIESFSRVQLLAAMGITAIVLLIAARVWLWLDNVRLLPSVFSPDAVMLGLGIGIGITLMSELAYRIWKPYRESADTYLAMVLRPLKMPDLVWLGVLPGMSEELLFRGVMLPAIGMNGFGILISSLCFGVLHFFGARHLPYVVWATLIGVILAICTLYTQNLLVPIVAHVTTNILSSYLWKLRQISG